MKTSLGILAAIVFLTSIIGISTAAPLCHMNSTISLAGFVSHDDFNKLYQLIEDKDFTTADKFLATSLMLGTATMFEKGEAVYVEDSGGWMGAAEVRRPGELQTYWTWHNAPECPRP